MPASHQAKNYICGMPTQTHTTSLFPVNFITGVSDGLVLPFAACTIAYPHGMDTYGLIGIGIAVTLIGGAAYGLARFFGEREEIRHHHPQIALKEAEKEAELMTAIGIDKELTSDMQARMEAERASWLKEVEENEMGWNKYDTGRAVKSGLHTASGFLSGGLFICLPFLLFPAYPWLLLVWAVTTYAIFGKIRAFVTQDHRTTSYLAYLLKSIGMIAIACIIAFASDKMR